MSALGGAVHLLAAGGEVSRGWGTSVAVCGALVTSGAEGEEDPRYCADCVRAAIRWCVQPVVGDRG